MKIAKALRLVAPAAAAWALATTGAHANLIVNGGFETGNFNGWSQIGYFQASGVTTSLSPYSGPESGAYFAYLGTVTAPSTLSQTVSDNNGETYQVSFWLDASDADGNLTATWNGTTLYNQAAPSTSGWTEFTFDVVGTGSDTLSFDFFDDATPLGLDSVSVDAVPEPATWALILAGFAGLGAALRSRRRFAAA